MKLRSILGTGAGALLAASAAMAEDVVITVAPEQQTVIKEYVVKQHVQPVDIHADVNVGTTVPQTIDLTQVPVEIYSAVPQVRKYEYFYWNDRIVFVDPDSRKVVDIVQ